MLSQYPAKPFPVSVGPPSHPAVSLSGYLIDPVLPLHDEKQCMYCRRRNNMRSNSVTIIGYGIVPMGIHVLVLYKLLSHYMHWVFYCTCATM